MNNLMYNILYDIMLADGFRTRLAWYYKEGIGLLIDAGYIYKVKCNNAPDEMEIINEYIVGEYKLTEEGYAYLDFYKL